METKPFAALDVGGGTQDFLLWDPGEPIENAVKMVLPSPTRALAARIRRARAAGTGVHLTGWLMGGGAVQRALEEHLAAGLAVSAHPRAALTLADDLERVRAMGIAVREEAPPGARSVFCSDLDLTALRQMLAHFEAPEPALWAVAVCDHGFSPGFSNRKFRFGIWRDFLARGGSLEMLIHNQAPPAMTRMAAVSEQLPGVLLMDTAAAALWGALQDKDVAAQAGDGVCVVNLGNMHTVAFLLRGRVVQGIYEHHTGCLDAFALDAQLRRFLAGELSDEEVFEDRGHGCAYNASWQGAFQGPVVVTGPQRRLATGLDWPVAVPHGDVMLSGCFGLVAAARARAGGRG